MSEAEQEKVVAEASAVIEKEVQDVAAAFDGVVQEVKKTRGRKRGRRWRVGDGSG
jgi:uncharacterized protein (DUF885 family)